MTCYAVRQAQIEVLKRAMAKRHEELLGETREDIARAREETYGALEIERLEAALARIDQGTFGRCIQCGVEIDIKRLAACPVATRCAACQSAHERTFAHSGEPTPAHLRTGFDVGQARRPRSR